MMGVLDGPYYIVELVNVGCTGHALHNVDLSCKSSRCLINCLSLLKAPRSISRQVPLEESDASRLHAVFQAKLAEMRERENISHDSFSLAMGPSLDIWSYGGCIDRGVRFHMDVENERLNVLEIIVGHCVGTMSSFLSGFEETDALFFKFDDAFNNMGGSSFVGDTLASRVEKPISLHVVLFHNTIGVCMRDTFLVCYLKWANVPPEYIEVVNQDTLRWSRTLYRDPKQTRANSTHRLVGRLEDWYFLCDHYLSRAFQEQSRTSKATSSSLATIVAVPSHFYNDNPSSLNNEKQMLELQSQPTLKGSQPLFRDEICEIVLGRRSDHSKGLGWRHKPG
ncbi:CACTA en-spm transposon protein [Cucumis melo var. makuwa]|uniref:CACTA en-spm transposon protein n=1 Tax=Cucumis melo var. makuwa TaxID=1194695 RepID=A0A5D3BTL2_CUCMM|nr:CACTA en-spm transposon protein [Cucumis melo var. makuwa]